MENIKEEIERIKSLFTEDRLYGNLITEMCGCSDTDMIAALKDGTGDKYDVFKKGVKTGTDCETNIGDIPHLKCVKEALDAIGGKLDHYRIFKQGEKEGVCYNSTKY